MRRSVILLALIAACGGAVSNVDPTSPPASTVTTQPGGVSTTESSSQTTQPGQATSTTDSGRQAAPDFTLALGEGGSYTLSEGAKPVYLVFWAEW